ncbi:hypothetical protein APSETT445_007268 [Aspergillus pseudonomiae]
MTLGIAESGLFPGVVFYLSMWYKRSEQHYRVALFFSAASLAGAFGGVLAWAQFERLTDNEQPTIIKELGYTAAEAQLLSVPPYAVATILTITVAVLSERTGRRAPFIMGSTSFACIGYIILLTDHRPGVSYVGTIFAAAGIYPAVAIVLSWPANNVSGQTKRAIANAMQISIGNLGAVLGTQLYRTETSPRYYLGHGFALGYLVANIIVVGILWQVLRRENIRKAEVREREGLQALMGDIGNSEGEFQGDKDPRWIFQT